MKYILLIILLFTCVFAQADEIHEWTKNADEYMTMSINRSVGYKNGVEFSEIYKYNNDDDWRYTKTPIIYHALYVMGELFMEVFYEDGEVTNTEYYIIGNRTIYPTKDIMIKEGEK